MALVVAAPTPEGLLRALEREQRRARVVELRLDSLGSVAAIVSFLERLSRQPRRHSVTFIATCRGRAEGGRFGGGPAAQLAVLALAVRAGCQWADIEAASLESLPAGLRKTMLPRARLIVSHHDFQRTPSVRKLRWLFQRMSRLGGDLVKIAVTARRQSDNATLLTLARRARRRLIAVSMGAAGIPGRVLALRAGSPLTYAAPDEGPATAPGQLRWSELRETYRAPHLGSRTRVYGVIGRPTAHSLSPAMHNAAFRAAGLDAVYLPFEVADLRDFLGALGAFGVAGFSVTIPHKQGILRHLDAVDPLAELIGAVNTVVVRGSGKLYGYNPDYVGVLRTLQRYVRLEGSRALIVGAGGA
ncbi:MAG: type I 3-dehydroquinate dehydratase, partial [Candidatus Acidiferrales bacterium]